MTRSSRIFKVIAFSALFLILSAMLCIAGNAEFYWWDGSSATCFASGEGTETDPYVIMTPEQLKYFADQVNSGNSFVGKYIELRTDISLNDTMNWESWEGQSSPNINTWIPIGYDNTHAFQGNFNGNYRSIDGIYIIQSQTGLVCVGLFGYVGENGVIRNLNVERSYIGRSNSGAVAGYNNGTIKDCHNSGKVLSNSYIGGITGYNYGSIIGCSNTGVVSGLNFVGGIIGYNNGSDIIEDCENKGTVHGINDVGGIVGKNDSPITKCYNTGAVTGNINVGGIVGNGVSNWIYNSVIRDCYNTGYVSATSSNAGGIAGRIDTSCLIETCYNLAEVTSASSYGSIVGDAEESQVTNCYYRSYPLYLGNNYGTALPDELMQVKTSYVGFDFRNVWVWYTDYPTLWSNSTLIPAPIITKQPVSANYSQYQDAADLYIEADVISDETTMYEYEWYLCDNYNLINFGGTLVGYEDSYSPPTTESGTFYYYAVVYKTTDTKFGPQTTRAVSTPATIAVTPDGESTIWDGSSATDFAYGNGTEDDPYVIMTAEQFKYFADQVNGGETFEGEYIELGTDIWLNETSVWENWDTITPANIWTSIGLSNNESRVFKGTFDGIGYAIKGLYINSTDIFAGLFGYNKGTVKNVGVVQSYIKGSDGAGSIVGHNADKATVENCYFTGTLVCDNGNVGGIVGLNSSGGIINNCYNTGNITLDNQTKPSNLGGIAGCNQYGIVINSYNTGKVTTSDAQYNIHNEYTYVGGIVGNNLGNISGCYNKGDVIFDRKSSPQFYIGGIVGYQYIGVVKNSFNTGNVKSTYSTNYDQAGGIAGFNYSYIFTCYNIGYVQMSSPDYYVGGVVGYNPGNAIVKDCYYLENCGNILNEHGQALSDEDMQLQASFVGFDFDDVWTMDGGFAYNYPKLRPSAGKLVINAQTPIITLQPSSGIYAKNASGYYLNIRAVVDDGGNLNYIWWETADESTSGGEQVNVSDRFLVETSIPGTYYYYVWVLNTVEYAVENKYASVNSNPVVITVLDTEYSETPTIGTNLNDGEYLQHETAEPLTVTATVSDGGTLSYQWYKNTSPSTADAIPVGEDSPTFTPPTDVAGTTYYYVVVTNSNSNVYGLKPASAESDIIAVTVEPVIDAATPTITEQPESAGYYLGDVISPLTIEAIVSDDGELSYEWYSNTIASTENGTLVGEGDSYTPNITAAGTYYYYAVVKNYNKDVNGNKYATATSDVVTITVNIPGNAEIPVLGNQPQDAVYGQNVSAVPLNVNASVSDGGTLSYKWYRTSVDSNIGGEPVAETETFTPPTDTIGTYYYYVEVTNTNEYATGEKTAKVTSQPAEITVVELVNAQAPSILTVPGNVLLAQNSDSLLLTVLAAVDDGGTLSYEWYRNTVDSNIGGTLVATTKDHAPSTDESGIFYYYVVVTNTNSNVSGAKTATAVSSTFRVNVATEVSVRIDPRSVTLTRKCQTVQLSATVSPSGEQVIWEIVTYNGNRYADIDHTGRVTAKENGTVTVRATINATTAGGSVCDEITVTVRIPAVINIPIYNAPPYNPAPEKEDPEPVKEDPETGKDDPAPQDSKPDDEAKPWTNPYTDVRESDDYYTAVQTVSQMGIMIGVSDDSFAPENELTRAMFVTILGRLSEIDAEAYSESNFTDVAPDAWYLPYVEWASSNGLVYGYGDGKFGTDDSITLDQLLIILYRFTLLVGYDITAEEGGENDFIASTYAKDAVNWALNNGIIVPEDKDFTRTATRADVAVILYNYLQKYSS